MESSGEPGSVSPGCGQVKAKVNSTQLRPRRAELLVVSVPTRGS